jgi:hypothetical protein
MPWILLSDQGPQFTRDFWTQSFNTILADIRPRSTYYPQSNGAVSILTGLLPFMLQFAQSPRAQWDAVLEGGNINLSEAVLHADVESGSDLALRLGFDVIQI